MSAFSFNSATTWLHVNGGLVSQSQSSAGSGWAGLTLGGGSAESLAAFRMNQARAVDRVTGQALQALAAVRSVEIPQGETIGGLKSVISSDPASLTGRAEAQALEESYQLQVLNLASSRTARSLELTRSGQDLAAGTYTLTLAEGDRGPVEISLQVDYSDPFPDDNRRVLRRLATAIEASSATLSARVVSGAATDENSLSVDTVYLEVQSRSSGSVCPFSLEDAGGDLVETLGLNRIRTGGRDLTYLQGTRLATAYEVFSSDYTQSQPAETLTPKNLWLPALSSYQVNRSLTLDPQGTTDLTAGYYRFRITRGSESREVGLLVDYQGYLQDDNQSLLDRLARAVERAAPDIQARVDLSEALDQDGQSVLGATLYLADRLSGQEEAFSLKDVEGDLIHGLGLDRVFRPAQAAAQLSAGQASTRAEDSFSLDQLRLTVQAHQISASDPVQLTVTGAQEVVVNQVERALWAHNSFLAASGQASPYLRQTTAQGLARNLLLHSDDYAQAGLEVADGGWLTLAEDFDDSLETDLSQVRTALEGQDGLLTVIDTHLSRALASGFQSQAVDRGGLFYNDPPGSTGFDPQARAALNWRLASGTSYDPGLGLMSQLV